MKRLYGVYVRLVKTTYHYTESLAVVAVDKHNEPVTDISVCLPDFNLHESKELAFVDINNNPGIEKFLIKNKIAINTGITFTSGYVSYPLYRFNLNKLEEY